MAGYSGKQGEVWTAIYGEVAAIGTGRNKEESPDAPADDGIPAFEGAIKLAEVTYWSFDSEAKYVSWASTTTPGYDRTVAGSRSATGLVRFKLDDTTAQYTAAGGGVYEGQTVYLWLCLDGGSWFRFKRALITRVRVELDLDTGDVVAGEAEFRSDGEFGYPGVALSGDADSGDAGDSAPDSGEDPFPDPE